MMRRNSEHEAVAKRKVPTVSLCNLPVDILITILSLLPINDAIRTSVLSRKFRYAWCSHTNLTFDEGTMRDKDFVTKVDAILHKHSGMGVEHLEIKFRLHRKHSAHIDTWVQFAIASKTKEFVINLSGKPKSAFHTEENFRKWLDREEPYNLPSQLFSPGNGSYLQYLDFRTVSLQLPSDFKGFPNLKSLALLHVSITDKDVQWVLSKCNLLEFFEIAYCRMVTSIRVLHPLDRLKHLVLDRCPTLKVIELYCSPTTLMYTGKMVPLIFASTSRLTNINVFISDCQSSLSYILTDFPRASPRLETLTLKCADFKRTIVPEDPFKFAYLRNLRLELLVFRQRIDVLDYAYLLKIAPFMETLELLMWMPPAPLRPYCKEDGELRSGVPQQHRHLKSVRISGFVGFKDQVELALNILGSCMVLEKMEITPRQERRDPKPPVNAHLRKDYVDGHRVATEFVCKADHRNVVNVFF